MILQTLILTVSLFGVQDAPQAIAKKDLPKAAICTACNLAGEGHGEEKPAGGLLYKGKTFYFCNLKEVEAFKKDPEAYIPLPLPRSTPEFSLKDASGFSWNQSSLEKKVVLIDFWATWCGPCKEMFPILERLRSKYQPRGFELLSVSVDEKKADFDKYVRARPFKNPVLHDQVGTFGKWGVRSIPAAFLVANGQVIGQWTGKQSEKTLDAAIRAALGD